MTPAAAAAPHTTPHPICRISRNSQKRRKTQNIYTMSMGVHRKENVILEKYFFIYMSMGVHRNENVIL